MARSQGHQDGESCPADDSSALRHATGGVPKPAPDTIHVRGLQSSPWWTQYMWLHQVQLQQSLEELYKRVPGTYGHKAQSPCDERRFGQLTTSMGINNTLKQDRQVSHAFESYSSL